MIPNPEFTISAFFSGDRINQVIGHEAAMWTEQVDSVSIDSRIWPRAAALAEVVWSEPSTDWRDAEVRMIVHRQRLIEAGINAEAITPEWCRHKQEVCREDSYFNILGRYS